MCNSLAAEISPSDWLQCWGTWGDARYQIAYMRVVAQRLWLEWARVCPVCCLLCCVAEIRLRVYLHSLRTRACVTGVVRARVTGNNSMLTNFV